jgi:hypothetical protein
MAGISHWTVQVFEAIFAIQALRLFHVIHGFQVTISKTGTGGFF